MEQHWKLKDLGLTIVFSVIYFAVVLAATIMGGIHPLLYLFVTTLIALVAWIPYMYVMAKVPKAGVVLVMSIFVCKLPSGISRIKRPASSPVPLQ